MSTTWTQLDREGLVVVADCSSGTESAPSSANDGLNLKPNGLPVAAVAVHVEVQGAGAMTANGAIDFYVYNPSGGDGTGKWNLANDLKRTVAAQASQAFVALEVHAADGRIAAVPNGVGKPVKIFLRAVPRRA